MSVTSELLAQSLAAHRTYQSNLKRRTPQGLFMGDPEAARQSLQSAFDLRQQADKEDPAHLDPAWLMDPVAHRDLIAFYEKELAK